MVTPAQRQDTYTIACDQLTAQEAFFPEYQRTLKQRTSVTGIEPYGGREVRVTFYPTRPDTGIIFVDGNKTPLPYTDSVSWSGLERVVSVHASLAHAQAKYSSLMLEDGTMKIASVEHLLATLYALGVDNAVVEVTRTPSSRWHHRGLEKSGFMDITSLPVFADREETYVRALLDAGVTLTDAKRKLLRLPDALFYPRYSLTDPYIYFEPAETKEDNNLVLLARTSYPELGDQYALVTLTPTTYLTELARARPYAKHVWPWIPKRVMHGVASLVNIRFGIGHGFSEENMILPYEGWTKRLRYENEIARHAIVDRLGAVALLPGRLVGVSLTSRYSGHANDLAAMRRLEQMLAEEGVKSMTRRAATSSS